MRGRHGGRGRPDGSGRGRGRGYGHRRLRGGSGGRGPWNARRWWPRGRCCGVGIWRPWRLRGRRGWRGRWTRACCNGCWRRGRTCGQVLGGGGLGNEPSAPVWRPRLCDRRALRRLLDVVLGLHVAGGLRLRLRRLEEGGDAHPRAELQGVDANPLLRRGAAGGGGSREGRAWRGRGPGCGGGVVGVGREGRLPQLPHAITLIWRVAHLNATEHSK